MRLLSLAMTTGLVLLLGLSDSILATTVEKKSFKDLVLQAEMVAVGRVGQVESYPTFDQQYAYTYVTVGELEVLKGTYRQSTIRLRMDGGPLGDGKTLVVVGIPRFRPGEKVVLFVKGNGHHICPLLGWEQGLLQVIKDPSSGREILKTSRSLSIRAIEKGEFVVNSAADHNQAKVSAGVADYGQVQKLSREDATRASIALTLDELRRQVRILLTQAGPKGLPEVEVRSAEIRLDSPEPRKAKQLRWRN